MMGVILVKDENFRAFAWGMLVGGLIGFGVALTITTRILIYP